MARPSLPSWVWLLLAVAAVGFAIFWLSLHGASEVEPLPSTDEAGRRRLPPGGDFSRVRRDYPIIERERPVSSILPRADTPPVAPSGAGGSAPSSAPR
ncbi:MAG: hypothetical protein RL685_3680 [Pseudomonadota bacterium]|jgi:hypothetical protein